jgi:hypothetical protein
MSKLYRTVVGLLLAALLTTAARADGPDISARRLLDSWNDEDPGMKMVAEVIASAFASGFPGAGTPQGSERIAPRPISKGGRS